MPPYFRQPPAVLNCEKKILRWLGPFGFGFLSPQPPGIVGAGPNAGTPKIPIKTSFEGQRELVLFLFGQPLSDRRRIRIKGGSMK